MGGTLLDPAYLEVSHDLHRHLASLQQHISLGYLLHNIDL